MQTNREDVGGRYKEVLVPKPKSEERAEKVSGPFKRYFKSLADAGRLFKSETDRDGFSYIVSVGNSDS